MEYRFGVIGVFINSNNLLLVGERSDIPSVWQFPQGGIEPGESATAAFYREMSEELGTSNFSIIRHAHKQTLYRFPSTLNAPIAKKYLGQSLQWFLARFNAQVTPALNNSDGEFMSISWRSVDEVLNGVVEWKKPAYEAGLRLLGFLR